MNTFTLYPIKDGKVAKLRGWLEKLTDELREAAEATLEPEGVERERWWVCEIDGTHYVAILEERFREKSKDYESEHDIDKKHLAVMRECLEKGAVSELMCELTQKE